ncbi:MAG: methyltransferase domain-containing protein [Candidatus Helarchaeota archaeon]
MNIYKETEVITLNSVLHHIPDVDKFLSEVEELLVKDGLLIIAHEPNKLFYTNLILREIYRVLGKIVELEGAIYSIIKRIVSPVLGVGGRVRKG